MAHRLKEGTGLRRRPAAPHPAPAAHAAHAAHGAHGAPLRRGAALGRVVFGTSPGEERAMFRGFEAQKWDIETGEKYVLVKKTRDSVAS